MDPENEKKEPEDINAVEEPAAGEGLRQPSGEPPDDLELLHEPAERVAGPETKGPEPVKPVKTPPEKQRPSIWIRLLRWTIAILIVFGLGFIVAVFLLYLPTRQNLTATQSELRAARQEVENVQTGADQEITQLQNRIAELEALETRNQELLEETQDTRLHVVLLGVLSDVYRAQLALEQEDPTRANLALAKTGEKLDQMSELLPAGQAEVVSDMQERLDLALAEISDDVFAAQSDLLVLVNMLQELENTYFANP